MKKDCNKHKLKDIHPNLKLNYKHKYFWIRWYFNKQMKLLIKFAKPKKKDIILDFGCGNNILKEKLPNYNIIGYDINPSMTDIDDYKKVKPDIVFASHSFEHLTKEELNDVLYNFKKINKDMVIITSLPKKNLLANLLCWLTRRPPFVHKQTFREVINILNNHLILEEEKVVAFIAHTAKWSLK